MKLHESTVTTIRKDFPIFQTKAHGKSLVYMDNAATTQKPRQVITAIQHFYEKKNANIHRGVYQLSEEATGLWDEAHAEVAKFIGAKPEEIIFTRNATESINLVAHSIKPLLKGRKEILLTKMEHHSNLVPWQQLARQQGMKLRFIPMKDDLTLDYGDAEEKITEETGILAVNHASNALGTINDVQRLINLGKKHGALTLIDGAQSVPHLPVDVQGLGADFLAFSSHKMLGPDGVGVLFGRRSLLEEMPPYQTGGDMISEVSYEKASWNGLPMKFQAGTPSISGGVGLTEAIKYLSSIGLSNIRQWEHALMEYAIEKMEAMPSLTVYNPGIKKSIGIISFNIKNAHAHDVASLMADENICIRGGHHCAMPLMSTLGVMGTSRASFYLYNTFQDIDRFIAALHNISKVFNRG